MEVLLARNNLRSEVNQQMMERREDQAQKRTAYVVWASGKTPAIRIKKVAETIEANHQALVKVLQLSRNQHKNGKNAEKKFTEK